MHRQLHTLNLSLSQWKDHNFKKNYKNLYRTHVKKSSLFNGTNQLSANQWQAVKVPLLGKWGGKHPTALHTWIVAMIDTTVSNIIHFVVKKKSQKVDPRCTLYKRPQAGLQFPPASLQCLSRWISGVSRALVMSLLGYKALKDGTLTSLMWYSACVNSSATTEPK